MSAEHIISTLANKKGNCICLLKQDLSTEIPQLKDQLIFISIERGLPVLLLREGLKLGHRGLSQNYHHI